MENRKVTIHDIAARLSMSASTVSRALGGNKRISQKTIDKVRETAIEMGYKPNSLAASFRTGKSRTIGVIIPRINRHFFSNVIAGIEEVTNPAGYNLMICQTNEHVENEKRNIETLMNNRVDGIIMSISSETREGDHIKQALKEGVTVVQFDRVSGNIDIDKVVNDNLHGAYELTKHLIEQGYRRIFHLAGPFNNNVYIDRHKGFVQAMNEHGLKVADGDIILNAITRERGFEVMEQIIKNDNLPDAIFAASDYAALGVLMALKKYNIEVPKRIGVAGYSNEPFTEIMDPELTTVEQFAKKMGKKTGELMLDDLENGRKENASQTILVEPKLIVRGSTLRNNK